jgi:hypothetical protein
MPNDEIAPARGAWGALAVTEPLTLEQIEAKARYLLAQMSLEEKVAQMSGDAPLLSGMLEMMRGYNTRPIRAGENRRLGIPGIRFSDGPRGVVMYHSTCFPVSMARGATWDTGGDILDAVLSLINLRARIVLCGLISQYNATQPVPGPYYFGNLLTRRARVEGFIVLDYAPRFQEAVRDLSQWYAEGKLRYRVEVVEGLENAPRALNKLFDGSNQGKLIVKLSTDSPS